VPGKLETRTARRRLKAQHKPYYLRIGRSVYLSYRRGVGQPEGRWGIRTYAGDKRYKEKSFAIADDVQDSNGRTVLDFDEAQDRARVLAKGFMIGDQTNLGTTTVSNAMEEYAEWLTEHRKSADQTKCTIKAHIKPKLGKRKIASLTTPDLRRWHSDLAKAPARIRGKERTRPLDKDDPEAIRKRRATANRVLTVLKAGLNYAFREGAVDDDTAWRRVKPFGNVDAPRVRFLTVRESQRLINSATPDLRNLIRGALHSGARYGELVALRVEDYDTDGGTIYIRDSKSGRPRHVPLNDEGQGFFEGISAGRKSSETLFLRDNGEPWGKSHQARPLKEAVAKAKLHDVSFHILRHTYGSFLAAEGVPLQVIAAALGHADTRTTEKHYAHLLPDHVAATIRASLPTISQKRPKVRQLKGRAK
jgi:integrase